MMKRHWRISIVALAVLAMLLPGVDPISYIVEFIPLLVLYGLSYFLVKLVEPKRAAPPRCRADARLMILGADWVLPVDGAPIARRRRARSRAAEVAEVSADLEPDQRFAGCAILPGLVNAHTHLEYAGMSGFGDGEPFDGWIADHIRRRDGLGRDDYLAQARAASPRAWRAA